MAPIEELVAVLLQAVAEAHLKGLGFDPDRLCGATGFTRIEGLRDAVDALYKSDETKHRFEIMARQVFIRFKALLMEPSAFAYAERHDNIEACGWRSQNRRSRTRRLKPSRAACMITSGKEARAGMLR